MKKILGITLLLSVIFVGCTSGESKKKVEESSKSGYIITPDAQMFKDLVWDYEASPKEWKLKGDKPVVIDFYADWCAPCRTSSPIIEELAREYAGKVIFYKIDIDKNKALAEAFGIQTIPTFMFAPIHGTPEMTGGIAPTPEATRKMLKDKIEEVCLNYQL
ncbi:MAG: thioredoxin domain-containing protein [Bacteroidales bacterium]|nr:thioredoxin domain-containing protein [Bacteroidales bacterium]